MTTPILVAQNVSKIYHLRGERVVALRNLSFEVFAGEFLAIMGSSGSGKSTLLNVLAGLEIVSSGTIRLDDKELDMMTEDERATYRQTKIGFVFQSFNLIPSLDIHDNVLLPLVINGVAKHQRVIAAEHLLDKFGLNSCSSRYPYELSGGQQQRAAIARALIVKPRLIFADEPTGNLDSKTADGVMEMLHSVVEDSGTTLLLVTHDKDRSKGSDRCITLKDGEIIEVEDLQTP